MICCRVKCSNRSPKRRLIWDVDDSTTAPKTAAWAIPHTGLGLLTHDGFASFSQRIEVAIYILGTKISTVEVDLIWGQDHCKFLALAK